MSTEPGSHRIGLEKIRCKTKEKKQLVCVIAAVLVLASLAGAIWLYHSRKPSIPDATRPPMVVFDQSKNQLWSLWDTGFAGFSRAALALRDNGYIVAETYQPLTDTLSTMNRGDVLVLGISYYKGYTSEEVEGVVSFVERGGGVLLMSEHDNFYNNIFIQNQIAHRFGIHFTGDHILDEENSEISPNADWIYVRSPELGVEKAVFYTANWIDYNGSADFDPFIRTYSTSTPEEAVVGARKEVGKGRLVAVTDTEFFWNGDDQMGIRSLDNEEMFLKIIDWLSGTGDRRYGHGIRTDFTLFTGDQTVEVEIELDEKFRVEVEGGSASPTSFQGPGTFTMSVDVKSDGHCILYSESSWLKIMFFSHEAAGGISVVIDERHGARGVDAGPSGLYGFAEALRRGGLAVYSKTGSIDPEMYDIVVLATPLGDIPSSHAEEYANFRKVVLLNDEYNNMSEELNLVSFLQEMGLDTVSKAPINEVARLYGLDFPPVLLSGPASGFGTNLRLPVSGPGWEAKVYRGGVIYNSTPMHTALPPEGVWGDVEPFYLIGVGIRQEYDPEKDAARPAVGAWSDSVFAFASAYPVANAHLSENTGLVDFLLEWSFQE